jgi:hypothetical protein
MPSMASLTSVSLIRDLNCRDLYVGALAPDEKFAVTKLEEHPATPFGLAALLGAAAHKKSVVGFQSVCQMTLGKKVCVNRF